MIDLPLKMKRLNVVDVNGGLNIQYNGKILAVWIKHILNVVFYVFHVKRKVINPPECGTVNYFNNPKSKRRKRHAVNPGVMDKRN
jgi:hypothetical protein